MIWFRRAMMRTCRLKAKTVFASSFVLIVFSSVFIWLLEPQKFKSPFEGLWWTMTTLATVGYGDLFPETVLGRLWAIFLFCVGIALFTFCIGKSIDYLSDVQKRMEEGKMDFMGKRHVVVIGWSGKAYTTVKNILAAEPDTEVVLIDEKLEKNPMDKKSFYFVQGVPSRDNTLLRANIAQAKKILIFAEAKLKADSPFDADARTAFVLTSVRRIAPGVPTSVEVALEENVQNFGSIASNVEIKLSDESFAAAMYPISEK